MPAIFTLSIFDGVGNAGGAPTGDVPGSVSPNSGLRLCMVKWNHFNGGFFQSGEPVNELWISSYRPPVVNLAEMSHCSRKSIAFWA